MIPDRRLLIVTGKGGVGRSAVAAALALAASNSGRKVLALAMVGGDGLASHLGADSLSASPQAVRDGLYVAAIDPRAALDEYVRLRLRTVPRRLGGRVFGALAQTVPGVHDIIVVGKCIYEAMQTEWDQVVVDAVATGQVESMLRAPSTVALLAPKGKVHEQAVDLGSFLSDPEETGVVVVATPEELALTEALTLTEALAIDRTTSPPMLLVNRLLTEPEFESAPAAPSLEHQTAIHHLALLRSQRAILKGHRPDTTLPFVFGAANPAQVSTRLAAELSS